MFRFLTVLLFPLVLVPLQVSAQTKPCEELKAEIETKIQSRGVASYTLEIVDAADVEDPNMIVGTCDGGTRKIIYQRNDD